MHRILLSAIIVLALASCQSQHQVTELPDTARADSIMEAAHITHNPERIFFLADSLEAAGAFSKIKADYWRGYSYYVKWDNHMSQEYWYEAISLEIKDREDLIFHGRAANRLSDVMLGRGDYEAAMRIALPAIEKLRKNNETQYRDYGYLLVTVGCCELNNRNNDLAATYFDESYKLYMLLIEDNSIDGGSTHEDNLKSAVAGFTTIARHYLDNKLYSDALTWVNRLEYVLEDYKRQPETTQESIDRRQTLAWIFRASALEGMGNHDAAVAAYNVASANPFCSSPQGKVEAARYLMLAKRWGEAAENYAYLDRIASVLGAGLTLDNIQLYLLPKFRANFNARRNDDALATGMKICESLDSAIVWNHNDKAAELATIFHTQDIKEEVAQQKAHLERLRFASAVAVIVLLVISFLIFVIIRQRGAIRLEDAYRKLAIAKAQADEASRVKTAFLHQISHEIRTPLNLLSGFAQLLTTPGVELDEQSKAQINNGMIDNTGRITSLVSKILDLSDLISKTELDKKDRVVAMDIASQAADSCGIREAEGINFAIQEASAAKDLVLTTNKQASVRILGLLLENAAKYTGQGSVTLRIVTKQESVFFLVEDTGIGVPAEEAEHIFEHFVQLDDYREGTGIGLPLARTLARRLGGDVVLDTTYSFGARFVFTLPLNA
ncbi:MAG: HAMP domain-containing histidine kinase [Bacteroidales bacterium]|nr:HAMP domain-containing histidine kinase [Bacteroidales bacterium]